jgi:hypothetical protein
MPLWTFTAHVSAARQQELLSVTSFLEVVERIRTCSVENFKVEPRRNPPCLGIHRAFFRLKTTFSDYDAFFNSLVGYRAQYAISQDQGRRGNRQVIVALAPKCLDFAKGKEPSHFPRELIVASLASDTAKIWIEEGVLRDMDGAHIKYDPWLAKAAANSIGSVADMAARSKAEAGVLAPVGEYLELKGAWVASDGTECFDSTKEQRDDEIHDYGFS